MNLKEAFRYQNYLKGLASAAMLYLSRDENVTVTKRTHMRSAAVPGATDEEESSAAEREVTRPVETVIRFIMYIFKNKDELSARIAEAKATAPLDIDSACSNNHAKQQFARQLTEMSRMRSRECNSYDTGFKLNTDGNQVSYRYPVKVVTTIDFDRKAVCKVRDSLNAEINEMSEAIDNAVITTTVDYTAPFPLNLSWQEALEIFCESTDNGAGDNNA